MIQQLTLLFIGGVEIMFIMFIVVMVFGADKIPEIARGLGKGMRSLKDATSDIKHEVSKSTQMQNKVEHNITKDVNKEISKVKDELEDFTGSLKRN
ncbi:MAG: Sec-independent protein translocase subunit TatA/TatB, partial [Winogradskyella sp.]